jgi:acyl dehydratase
VARFLATTTEATARVRAAVTSDPAPAHEK